MSEPIYRPSKEDILAKLHELRLKTPELATPENAIKLLNYDHAYTQGLEELSPEEIEKRLQDLEDY